MPSINKNKECVKKKQDTFQSLLQILLLKPKIGFGQACLSDRKYEALDTGTLDRHSVHSPLHILPRFTFISQQKPGELLGFSEYQ